MRPKGGGLRNLTFAAPQHERHARIGPYTVGPGHPLLLLAGPCVIESLDLCLAVARRLVALGDPLRLVPLDSAAASEAFERLLDAEPLGSLHRIAREPALFELRGTRLQRLIRVGREHLECGDQEQVRFEHGDDAGN